MATAQVMISACPEVGKGDKIGMVNITYLKA